MQPETKFSRLSKLFMLEQETQHAINALWDQYHKETVDERKSILAAGIDIMDERLKSIHQDIEIIIGEDRGNYLPPFARPTS